MMPRERNVARRFDPDRPLPIDAGPRDSWAILVGNRGDPGLERSAQRIRTDDETLAN